MALLQINEPGLASGLHQRKRPAAGIDLGTTHSLIAITRAGTVEVLADNEGRHLLPSVVHYCEQGTDVGWNARSQAWQDPINTVSSVKRLMGRSLADIKQRYPELPYQFEASENGLPMIQTVVGLINPIQVSADILRALSARAAAVLETGLDAVVITVPAYFDDAQRQGTKDAAALAGLQVLRLLNEPTAAAIAYGLDSAREGIIVVYDLGGGTFDISVLRLRGGVFEVLATGGSAALGGDDFDILLAGLLRERAGMNNNHEPVIWRQLLDVAINGKIALSDADVAQIEIGGWQGEVTRQQFEELIRPLIRQTVLMCRRVLKDAGISIAEVQEVVMVGGSTRIPLVREYVGRFFQRTPLTSIDPDKVVAIGAAIQADVLAGNRPDTNLLLLDVTPLSLGLETMGGLVEKVIPRNTTLPVIKVQEFTTAREGQNAMTIHVLQGERELVADCRSLARFTLRGIPPLPAGAAHIRVTFQLDADGLLSVTAVEKSTGVTTSVQIKPAYGLSEQETARMLQDSMTHAGDDVKARTLAEQKVDAALMLEGVRVALLQDAVLLTEQESTDITLAVEQLQQVMQGNDVVAIRMAIKFLDEKTRDFAARRMDAAISRTLTGRFVDKV